MPGGLRIDQISLAEQIGGVDEQIYVGDKARQGVKVVFERKLRVGGEVVTVLGAYQVWPGGEVTGGVTINDPKRNGMPILHKGTWDKLDEPAMKKWLEEVGRSVSLG